MVVVCGEIEGKKKEDDVETEAADEGHWKPRCVCGEKAERKRKYDLFSFYPRKMFSNFAFSIICCYILTY
jgi:hypothetical protein